MATHASAEKAARQAIRHRERNINTTSQFKTAVKKLRVAMAAKYESKAAAKTTLQPMLNKTQQLLMRAASKKVIKRNTASRQVSRLSAAVNRVTA
jgi:small subunit ribosomal protein S20